MTEGYILFILLLYQLSNLMLFLLNNSVYPEQKRNKVSPITPPSCQNLIVGIQRIHMAVYNEKDSQKLENVYAKIPLLDIIHIFRLYIYK